MEMIEAGAPVANAADREGDGGAYYQTCRQKGLWPLKVTGFDPKTEEEKFTPLMAAKNVTSDYPPTLMIHGTVDTDVPFEQSEIMAREFEKHSVTFELVRVENGEHGLQGANPEDIEAAYAKVLPFVARFVPPPTED
jgi:dipeptidyl aminopeptidase/acylaminoacyl peptidase